MDTQFGFLGNKTIATRSMAEPLLAMANAVDQKFADLPDPLIVPDAIVAQFTAASNAFREAVDLLEKAIKNWVWWIYKDTEARIAAFDAFFPVVSVATLAHQKTTDTSLPPVLPHVVSQTFEPVRSNTDWIGDVALYGGLAAIAGLVIWQVS